MCDSNFIKKLHSDIQHQNTISANSELFIKNRNCKLHEFKKIKSTLKNNDLPIQSLLGSVFLIKNNSIIEFYSYCDYNYSMYLQLTKKRPLWIGLVKIINLELYDSESINFL